MKEKKVATIILLLVLGLSLISMASAYSLFPRPVVDNTFYPNTAFDFTFNFTLDNGTVLLSNTSTLTTDSSGVAFTDISIDFSQVPERFIHWRNDTGLQVNKSFDDKIFNKIYVNDSLFNSIKVSNLLTFGLGEVIDNLVNGWIRVNGNLNITDNLTVGGNTDLGFTEGSVIFEGVDGLSEDNSNLFYDNVNKRVGIGTDSPAEMLDIFNPGTGSGDHARIGMETGDGARVDMGVAADTNFYFIGRSGVNGLYFTTQGLNADIHFSTKNIERMRIDQNGNIGIGETSPLAKLHVDTGATTNIGQIIKGVASQSADYFNIDSSTGSGGDVFTVLANGNVGVGTDSPETGLHVVSSASNDVLTLKAGGSASAVFGSDNSHFRFQVKTPVVSPGGFKFLDANGDIPMIISTNGNVGINRENPLAKLHVQTSATTDIGSIFQGVASQSSDLTQWRDSAGIINSRFDSSGSRLTLGSESGGSNGRLIIQASDGSDWFTVGESSGLVKFNSNGGITIAGTTDLGARFNIATISDSTPALAIRGVAPSSSDLLRVSSPSVTTGDYFIIKGDGNVGIGTPTPNSKLEVNGTLNATSIIAQDGFTGNCVNTSFVSGIATGCND